MTRSHRTIKPFNQSRSPPQSPSMISKASSNKRGHSWLEIPLQNLRSCFVTFQLFSPKMNGTTQNVILCYKEFKFTQVVLRSSFQSPDATAFQNRPSRQLDNFLELELIEACHSAYSAPAMLVPKKNGKRRLVIDYRQLNKQTINFCWPIPSIRVIFDTWEGSCYFSTMDMSWGFYQLPMEETNQYYTAFSAHSDLLNGCACQWASPAVQTPFAGPMEKVLVGLTWNFRNFIWMIASFFLAQSKNT